MTIEVSVHVDDSTFHVRHLSQATSAQDADTKAEVGSCTADHLSPRAILILLLEVHENVSKVAVTIVPVLTHLLLHCFKL